MKFIVYNGASGGLGRHLKPALDQEKLNNKTIAARLESPEDLEKELNGFACSSGDEVTFVPMAAMVSVPVCEKNPVEARRVNVTNTVDTVARFLSWAEGRALVSRVLYVSTGHVYAPKKKGERLTESDPLAPRSMYAKTKREAEDKLQRLFSNHASHFKIVRVFGLLSVGQPAHYVLPALIQRVKQKNLSNIPGLSGVRDYLDARDVCRAIARLCAADWEKEPLKSWPVLNICSGEGTSIRDLLDLVIEAAGLSKKEVEGAITEAPSRADDIPWIVGDPHRVTDALGTSPRNIPLKTTVQEAFESVSS
jgi:nucleoside-diphosphate-sugar epimerase